MHHKIVIGGEFWQQPEQIAAIFFWKNLSNSPAYFPSGHVSCIMNNEILIANTKNEKYEKNIFSDGNGRQQFGNVRSNHTNYHAYNSNESYHDANNVSNNEPYYISNDVADNFTNDVTDNVASYHISNNKSAGYNKSVDNDKQYHEFYYGSDEHYNKFSD